LEAFAGAGNGAPPADGGVPPESRFDCGEVADEVVGDDDDRDEEFDVVKPTEEDDDEDSSINGSVTNFS
jgi:hypothetical protein